MPSKLALAAFAAQQGLGIHLDPTPAYKFFVYVELNGIIEAGFTSCSGLAMEREIIEHEEGGVNDYVHKLSGRTSYSNITLSQGITFTSSLWKWYQDGIYDGKVRRIPLSIIQYSAYMSVPARWYNLTGAFPVSWTGPELDAGSSEMAIESLEVAFEKIELDSVANKIPMSF